MPEPRIVAASQPRYLPSCAYLHRMLLADVFVYLDTVQYTPRDWENRNRVKSAAGPVWLTVPVVHVSRTQRVADTTIDDTREWRRRHLKTLELSYRRAPYFEPVLALVRGVLERPWPRLTELNTALAEALLAFIGRRANCVRASSLAPTAATGQDLLIELCHKVGGEIYFSGPHGRDYIDRARLRAAGLGLAFHDTVPVEHPQLFGAFTPNLSAIDLLFNCGPASAERLAAGNPTRADVVRLATEAA